MNSLLTSLLFLLLIQLCYQRQAKVMADSQEQQQPEAEQQAHAVTVVEHEVTTVVQQQQQEPIGAAAQQQQQPDDGTVTETVTVTEHVMPTAISTSTHTYINYNHPVFVAAGDAEHGDLVVTVTRRIPEVIITPEPITVTVTLPTNVAVVYASTKHITTTLQANQLNSQ